MALYAIGSPGLANRIDKPPSVSKGVFMTADQQALIDALALARAA
jgi:hypothetical protein